MRYKIYRTLDPTLLKIFGKQLKEDVSNTHCVLPNGDIYNYKFNFTVNEEYFEVERIDEIKENNNGTCKLMKRLEDIDGVKELPYESIEQIKRIICGTHNGVCSEKYFEIKK